MSETNEIKKFKPKRDIFRFNGEKPTAVNLEHVTTMAIEDKRITFNFYTNAIFVDLETEEAARNAFEQILNVWAAEVELKMPELNEEGQNA
jgi:hypothetical protein